MNNTLGLKCDYCKEITESTNPVSLKRSSEKKYHINCICVICKNKKSRYLSNAQVKILPDEIKNMKVGEMVKDNLVKEGGIFPLIPLIAAIAGGITALGTAGGATAGAILKAKENAENERYHLAQEEIMRQAAGRGFLEDSSKELRDRGINDTLAELDSYIKKGEGIPWPLIASTIIPLIPELIKAVPEVGDKIKSLFIGDGFDEDEAIRNSMDYLIGKGFVISLP